MKARTTTTLRGATWSALDGVMISPLVSKVKRRKEPEPLTARWSAQDIIARSEQL